MAGEHAKESPPSQDAIDGAPPSPADGGFGLIRRVAGGNEAAMAAIYDKWGQRVYAVALALLHDNDDAEDVVEETFWQVWRTASRYDDRRGTPLAWVLTIARTRALDRLRAKRRREDWMAAAATEMASVGGPADAEGGLDWAKRKAALVSALQSIPREQREALEMAFFGGLSHTEIAQQTSLPLGTVKTRIRSAMKKLRLGLPAWVLRGNEPAESD